MAAPDRCPSCGTPTSQLRPWLKVPVDVKKRQPIGSGTLVWCDDCSLGTTLHQPEDADLSAAYELSAYYTHGGSHMPDVAATLADRVLTKCAYLCDRGRLAAWENEIHAVLSAQGSERPGPRRGWASSLALIARTMAVAPDRKYDCIGFFARAA